MQSFAPATAVAPGVSATPKGSVLEYKLNRGQYLQLTQGAELTGSVIQAELYFLS